MSYGVGHRQGLDLVWLWLWLWLAATTPIRPLAWEYPHAEGVALKRQKKEDQKKKKKEHSQCPKGVLLFETNKMLAYSPGEY